MMKGIEFAEVRDILASAFTKDGFDMFLFEHLDFDRPLHIDDGPFKKVVTEVLKHFEQEGRDAFLIAEVAAVRPLRADVQEVYRKYARGLVSEAYSQRIEAEKLKALERYGLAPQVDLQRAGQAHLAQPQEGFQKRIRQALPDVDAWVFATQQLKQMRRVCRVEVDGAPLGTGFLVGKDAVLTNHHVLRSVIESQGRGDRVACRFDYHVGEGGTAPGTPIPLRGEFLDWHLDSSPGLTDAEENAGLPVPGLDQLDHALVRLTRDYGSEPIFPEGPLRGWVKVPTGPPALAPGMPVAILHHPQGSPVKLSLDTEAVLSLNASATRVRYTTNTDQGSSGSPCFDQDWNLVAMHHFGDSLHQKAHFNQGVPIRALRERLEKNRVAHHLGGDPNF